MHALVAWWILLALVAHTGAHVALLVGLAREPPRSQAWLGLVLPVLAPYYGWSRGMRRRTWVWLGALVAYALGIAVAHW